MCRQITLTQKITGFQTIMYSNECHCQLNLHNLFENYLVFKFRSTYANIQIKKQVVLFCNKSPLIFIIFGGEGAIEPPPPHGIPTLFS